MQRTINAAEHCLFADPPQVITLAAGVAKELLENEQGVDTGEIAYRYIQNTGGDNLYYSFGLKGTDPSNPVAIADNTVNYHGYLIPGAQLDCSNHRLRVCGWSQAGTTVATTVIRRNDLTK